MIRRVIGWLFPAGAPAAYGSYSYQEGPLQASRMTAQELALLEED